LVSPSAELTEQTDIWRCGIIFTEIAFRIVTGVYQIPFDEEPYKHQQINDIVNNIINNGLRPTLPAETPSQWSSLINRMLSVDPLKRPTIFQIMKELQ